MSKFRVKHDKDDLYYVEELREITTTKKVVTDRFFYDITFGSYGYKYIDEKNTLWIPHYEYRRRIGECQKQFSSLQEANEYIKRQVELPKYYNYDQNNN